MAKVILNGTIVTASETYKADLRIEGERISHIGKNLPVGPDDEAIDATGLLVMPGGVDAHTHFDLPVAGTHASDDFETGTRAAAFGGTTTVIDFISPARGDDLMGAYDTWQGKARGKACIDYGLHMSLVDESQRAFDQLDEVLAEGMPTIKIYTAYPDTLMISDGVIIKLLSWAAKRGALVVAHAENGHAITELTRAIAAEGNLAPRFHAESRPAILEGEATNRLIALAETVDAPIGIVHVTCKDALDAVRRARQRGLDVYAETCPHYLYLTEDALKAPGFEGAKFICSPPLRTRLDNRQLWHALSSGDIDTIATDHCPFNYKGQKELGLGDFRKIPGGLPGIETRLSLVWQGVRSGRISQNRFVELVSTAPARINGLLPRKGVLAPDADADIVLWDPEKELVLDADRLHMNVDYSPYEGMKVKGAPAKVFSRGELVIDGDKCLATPGRGRYLKRTPIN